MQIPTSPIRETPRASMQGSPRPWGDALMSLHLRSRGLGPNLDVHSVCTDTACGIGHEGTSA